MPNWCDNKVKITGPVDKLYNMAKAIEKDELLQHIVPLAEWDYGEATSSWGTKWDISEGWCTPNEDYTELDVYFQTAWGPPNEAFVTYMSENDDVEITLWYYEGGNDFCGINEDERAQLPGYKDPLWDTDDVLKECDEVFGIRENMEEWEEWGEENA
jgi:hypothetical protein